MNKLISIIILVLISVSFLNAQPGKGYKTKKLKMQKAWIYDQLNLSDDQKTKIDEIRYNHQMAIVDLRAEQKKNRISQNQIWKNDELNKQEYLDLVTRGNEIHSELKMMRAEMMMNIREILTEEQREKWQEHVIGNRIRGISREDGFERRQKRLREHW